MIKYHCSNIYNGYSNQIYPIYLSKIEYVDFICEKYPNGCAQISCQTVDGYWVSSLLKCYISKKGKYVNFGGTRIYINTKPQPFEIINIPKNIEQTIKKFERK